MPQLTQEAIEHIKRWEGLRLKAYQDQAGVWTIGYGHTRGVQAGDTCTEEQAEAWLREDLAEAEAAVRRLVTVPLSGTQYGALVSFTYNLGQGNLQRSTLLKRLNAGEYAAVPGELAKWNKVRQGGKLVVSDGLVNRRAAEAGMWAKGAHVAGRDVPAAPVKAPAPVMRPEVIGPVVGGAGTMLAAMSDLPLALQIAVGAAVILLAGAAAYMMVRKTREAT